MIALVQEFNEKFGLPLGAENVLATDKAAIEYRHKFLQEEVDEFKEAAEAGDWVKAFDALLDIVYVAQGTGLFMGVDPLKWRLGVEAVHKANMAKVRTQRPEDSKRGSGFDVIKPEGWTPPEAKLAAILANIDDYVWSLKDER